jgi:hypothetical protein
MNALGEGGAALGWSSDSRHRERMAVELSARPAAKGTFQVLWRVELLPAIIASSDHMI